MKIIIILPHKSLKATCIEAKLIYVCLQIKLKILKNNAESIEIVIIERLFVIFDCRTVLQTRLGSFNFKAVKMVDLFLLPVSACMCV